ncbi:glutathione S-transferase family protein [Enterovibrio coralii]|uniref:Glutathione S-transferase n=1 Tax=Enterovibrio coralii TaxID=294935 RepID=A0A135I3A8_9GAMM|nr:glutathione S-transferase family protein [Enterovibrio coralii]KXF79915.1 glutathione S-transferase [Enterovibrio coralii]
MSKPIIYHDPTSEPSRAVHWLCIEAQIPVDISYTWLTRGDHVSPTFLEVNPFHQVPALKHDDFCLSEASAIMNYLTDIHDVSETWFGHDIKSKAEINKLLSWYHTNLRRILTLDYFLPVLLMPAYLGFPKPPEQDIQSKLDAIHTMFEQLNDMLSKGKYLNGDKICAADILYACDVVVLDIDPHREEILRHYPSVLRWLDTLQSMESYQIAHRAWHHVTPLILAATGQAQETPAWVADACESVL